MAEEKSFQLRIVTPDRIFYEGEVSMVEFNTTEGEIGVLPGHIPMTVDDFGRRGRKAGRSSFRICGDSARGRYHFGRNSGMAG